MLALPIFPASHPASIFGACELNFCVRYGNRWTLTPISTNYIYVNDLSSLKTTDSACTQLLKSVVTRTGFEPMLKA